MMPRLSLHAACVLATLGLAGSLTAQRTGGGNPGYAPGVKPAVVRPAKPAVVRPATPAVVTPARPLPPGTVLPPGTIVITPPAASLPGMPVLPGYHPYGQPSAWIGPVVVHETRSAAAPQAVPPAPSVPVQSMRLIAVLGALRRLDPQSGADLGLADQSLGVAVGMLTGYADDGPPRACGDFFGTGWDGPNCFQKSDNWKRGPFLGHPVMAVNEASPGPWEFEAAAAGRRISWMRLAVSLFSDRKKGADARPITFPRGRRAAMRDALLRVGWSDKGVAVPASGLDEESRRQGADVTPFGRALATFAESTMAPSSDHARLGIAEWFLTAQDFAAIAASCPSFVREMPDGAKLRALRSSASAPPVWSRGFDVRTDTTRYIGELWFLTLPDDALNQWLNAER